MTNPLTPSDDTRALVERLKPWKGRNAAAVAVENYLRGVGWANDDLDYEAIADAVHAATPNTDTIASTPAVEMREGFAALLAEVEANECLHESVHRGGSIWTICDDCGRKWADDMGGFPGYVEPAYITRARAALTTPASTPALAEDVEIPAGMVLVPREPTADMIAACFPDDDEHSPSASDYAVAYRAMLAAAPHTPTSTAPASGERKCPASPLASGAHQVDTSMESGPNNCFFCDQPMGRSPTVSADLEQRARELAECWTQFTTKNDGCWGNQADAYYALAKYAAPKWEALIAALPPGTNRRWDVTTDPVRVPAAPGSRPTDQAPAGLGGSRFDPSRVIAQLGSKLLECSTPEGRNIVLDAMAAHRLHPNLSAAECIRLVYWGPTGSFS